MNVPHSRPASLRLSGAALSVGTLCVVLLCPATVWGAPLLPDLFPYADEALGIMLDGAIDQTTIPGTDLYRFSVAIGNRGDGPFEVVESTADGTQTVWQNIQLSEGGFESTFVGEFDDPQPLFGHLFLESLARYSLREVLPDGTVGDVVATNDKTSFGVIDWIAFDTTLPGAPQTRVYTSVNDPALGISIGWADLYRRQLQGQWIDVTGLPGGEYWLETRIDPLGYLQETNSTNNTVRVLVELDLPIEPDLLGDYNSNGAVDAPDYNVWRDDFGSLLELAADGNGNGVVDAPDYVVWRDNFGTTVGASVPEPSSTMLGLAMILLLSGCRPTWRSA